MNLTIVIKLNGEDEQIYLFLSFFLSYNLRVTNKIIVDRAILLHIKLYI